MYRLLRDSGGVKSVLLINDGKCDTHILTKVKMLINKQNECLLKVQSLLHRKAGRSIQDTLIKTLIILCTAITLLLSSISVCYGHWLFVDGKIFGLWHFCILEFDQKAQCTADISVAKVDGLYTGLVFTRITVTLAVVLAMFGLEMLITSQLCQDDYTRGKWTFGSKLTLLSSFMMSIGMLTFAVLLSNYITFTGLSLAFWCEFIATCLVFLSSISGLQIYMIPSAKDNSVDV
ncbi:voltage-dependent calcium channel gamma-like subunit isoform X1 [Hypanus sabinus]|uniref:voltage-dependent calcium channel gamma-like subunit isoform X1 n=1 Tax=Hypanus sabinus TaxID=79690 RepID=UPI0028C4EBB4|nr:voltage-dependent calcium channel gamma-like subunit isoform X1 [Hypanus sabinus]